MFGANNITWIKLVRYYNYSNHGRICACGHCGYRENHYITYSDANDGNKTALCLGCKTVLNMNSDFAYIVDAQIEMVSANGSYILPSGIVVLVELDVEAYENGTLVFYNINNIPSAE